MARKRQSPPAASQLPNAPLVEVVFEFRWKLTGEEGVPAPFRQDPGYFVCLDAFVPKIKDYGFPESKRITPDAAFQAGQSIQFRFYRQLEREFPIVQIGPGILAVNDSSKYVWTDFKRLCLGALQRLLASYPKLRQHPLVPVQLELRYIDAFKPSATAGADLLSFLTKSTNLKIELPDILQSGLFDKVKSGQINLSFPVKGKTDTQFALLLTTGEVSGVQSIVLQSSITSASARLALGDSPRGIEEAVGKWLDDAHACTSPFFKGFVRDGLLDQFRKATDA